MSVARRLAEFVTETRAADLPPQTMDYAAMLIASTIASAAAGRGIDSARIIRELARARAGAPQASLWFEPEVRLPAADAAQVNAVMSDAAASDDSDLRAIVHCGTPLTAASLAIAEREGRNGEEVLIAIVLGYEAAGRIGEAITPGFRNRGFHGCLAAIFAGAVAAGRLLRLDATRMAQAIALSATSIGGLMAAANTSTAREYHAGLAAGAADREFSWAHAAAAKIADPVIHRLIDKIRVGPPPTGNAERYRQGATVTIRTTDGRVTTSTVFAPKGAAADGIAWADID